MCIRDSLGTDQIHVFPVSENVTDGVSHSLLNESEEFNIKVESGSGPRHICFHPNQKFAYLINEISKDFDYNIGFNMSTTKNKVVELSDADQVLQGEGLKYGTEHFPTETRVGKPIGCLLYTSRCV